MIHLKLNIDPGSNPPSFVTLPHVLLQIASHLLRDPDANWFQIGDPGDAIVGECHIEYVFEEPEVIE